MLKWTYEVCYEEAKKYKTRSEFKKNSGGAYDSALRNNWLDDYTWFYPSASAKKWTYETTKEESKKYKTKKEFSNGSHWAYTVSLKYNWINEYTWFVDGNKLKAEESRIWTYDTVKTEALKYKTKSEFKKNSSGAYYVARKNNWLKDYNWFIDKRFNIYTDKIDCVYVYEFSDQISAYIGRTLISRKKQRDREHLFSDDSVSRFAKSNNIPIPEMKILEDNLTLKEGSEREGYWVERYKSEGWTILNVAKTGSIGALGKGKWNYKNTYEEAKKYKTKSEFKKNSGGAYDSALRNNWLKDYNWFICSTAKNKKWTYEIVKKEASKYKSRTEFCKNSNSAYNVARENNWLDEFFPKNK